MSTKSRIEDIKTRCTWLHITCMCWCGLWKHKIFYLNL